LQLLEVMLVYDFLLDNNANSMSGGRASGDVAGRRAARRSSGKVGKISARVVEVDGMEGNCRSVGVGVVSV